MPSRLMNFIPSTLGRSVGATPIALRCAKNSLRTPSAAPGFFKSGPARRPSKIISAGLFDAFLTPSMSAGAKAEPPPEGLSCATFAAGCFWGVELAFQREPGVVSTAVGYTQGTADTPTYREVCSGSTGHTEAVYITYDPSVVTYERLLELFWERLGRSALTLNQVGNDCGTQYRSGVYYHDESQQKEAEKSKQEADQRFGRETVVELKGATTFWMAEDYHQKYLEKGGQDASKGATETIRCYG